MTRIESSILGYPVGAGQESARSATGHSKRVFDITFCVMALLFFSPLLLFIALAIFLEDGAPVFFTQQRTGLGGRRFKLYKFRSMKVCQPEAEPQPAEPRATQSADTGLELRQAAKGDARVTRVGLALRCLSWDELPQLFNILRGEMSLIGPRPHAIAHDQLWTVSVPNYSARFRVRPGLTGLAQVRGYRGEVSQMSDIIGRVEADNLYIDSWSLLLDFRIIAMTLPLLFNDPHAY